MTSRIRTYRQSNDTRFLKDRSTGVADLAKRAVVLSFGVLGVSGCNGAFDGLIQPAGLVGAPPVYTDVDDELAELEQASNADAISRYTNLVDQADASDQRKQIRNNIVSARLQIIDMNYHRFVQALHLHRNSRSVLLETIGLGLTAAASVVGGQAAIQALAVSATGVGGLNATLDAELYYAQTLPAIISQMEADRNRIRERIVESLSTDDSDYPLFLAFSDLDSYYRAGSVHGAIVGLTRSTGNELQTVNDQIAEAREAASPDNIRRKIIIAELAQELDEDRALEIAQALPSQGELPEIFNLLSRQFPDYQNNAAQARQMMFHLLTSQTFKSEDLTAWEQAIVPIDVPSE